MEKLYGGEIMTIDDEIIVMWIEFFASVMCWSWFAALASFIIFNILFLFFKLLKTENVFLDVCALVYKYISRVLAYISLAATILMIIPTFLKCCNK